MRKDFGKFLKRLKKLFPDEDLSLIREAYRVASEAHQPQIRESGEPYVTHVIEVARILAAIGLDLTTITAGLLHDVLEDSHYTVEYLEEHFGEEIARLVDGVTKISTLRKASVKPTQEEKQAENLRKMLIATARDVRVILIKLADRLHNMRTIEFLPEDKRIRISQETLDIYAPLAHRLGIARWQWELEDHAFHQLNPGEYKEMARLVAMTRKEREQLLNRTIEFLEGCLEEAEIAARVIGRPKHLYSIYRKMIQHGKDFEEVMDVLALRILTQTESGCYNALGVVHQLWTPVPGRFKDYVAMPKTNMYQSIHTTVMTDQGRSVEVQIRTEEMDRTAREGIAAHWKYKDDGRRTDAKAETQLQWLRQMYEWLQHAHAPAELIDSVRRDFTSADVYVFSPKGDVKELPAGATPLDFAYTIHTDIGHQCIGARVHGRMVSLRYNLQTGDIVEILTSKNQHPSVDWIDLVVTGRARTRIRQRLRELGKLAPVHSDNEKPAAPPAPAPPKKIAEVRVVDNATRQKLIRVEGAKGVEVQFGKCCDPMPGHAVIGYITKNPGITIHRGDCKAFTKTVRDPQRLVEASWDGDVRVEAAVRVTMGARPNVLADITNAMRPMNVDIVQGQYFPGEDGRSYFEFVFDAASKDGAERVIRALRNVSGVTEVTQVPPNSLLAKAE